MGLQLFVLLSFSIILLLSTIYGSSSAVRAQLTNFPRVAIPSSVNIVQIKQQQEQQSNNNRSSSSSTFVFASPSTNIRNPLPIMSSASSGFSSNYPSFQLPPIANTGHNQTVTAGSTVILNGSKSKSPNGIILGYSWKQIPTHSINLGGVNSSVWEFTAPRVTTNTLLQFQLNVTDNWGQTGTSFINVLDKPAMAIHSLSLSSSPQIKSLATTTKTATSNNHNKAQNNLVNIPTNYNIQNLPSPKKRHQQQLQQPPPLVPPISNLRKNAMIK